MGLGLEGRVSIPVTILACPSSERALLSVGANLVIPPAGFEKGHRSIASWVKNGAKEEVDRTWVLGKRPMTVLEVSRIAEDS